jgi:hypothetical protein
MSDVHTAHTACDCYEYQHSSQRTDCIDTYTEDFDVNRPVNCNFRNTSDTKVLIICALLFINLTQ